MTETGVIVGVHQIPAAAIEVEDLAKSFRSRGRTVHAVDGLSFSVSEGEIFGLLGPNGAGKTTTLRMLTTLLPIDAGRARIAGADVATRAGAVRRRIGYVSQAGGADLLATGRENLALQGALYGMTRADLTRRMPETLDLLRPGLTGDWDKVSAAFDSRTYLNRIGVPARADRRSDLTAALASRDLAVRGWYGVRVFTDTAADDEPVPDRATLEAIVGAEERAGRTDPYRGVAALLHLIAAREPDR